MDNIIIRQALEDDARLLARLGELTFREAFAHMNNEEDLENYIGGAFSIEQISSEVLDNQNQFLIAENQGSPVGYAKLSITVPPSCVTKTPAIELNRFYALKKWWGLNVGNALMGEILALTIRNGFYAICLSSWKKNDRANSFYGKWDFKIAGERQFLLGTDIQEDFVLVRTLTNITIDNLKK